LNNILNDPNVAPYISVVEYHIGDSYQQTWGSNRFSAFYRESGYPVAWFDGLLEVLGAGSIPSAEATYRARIATRRSAATNVAITVTGVQQTGATFTIRAHVCVEPGTTRSMRLYMVAVHDNYPKTPNYSRDTFMQAASTVDVTLAAGECYLLTNTITFDTASWNDQTNIRVIVWAQVPSNTGPAEVYNSAVLTWPFGPDCNVNGIPDDQETDCNGNGVPDDCDIAGGTSDDCNADGVPDECELAGNDCNNNGIPDDCDIASGFSQDANGNGIPDECESLKGDLNCDGTVNFGDINPFVMALTSPDLYPTYYPDCNIMNADINLDGTVGFGDINPFVQLLTNP
jgi:hypothetical protein